MKSKIVAICPTVERADLVRQLVQSYKATAGDRPPPIVFVVQGQDDGTEGWLKYQAEQGLAVETLRLPEVLPYAKAVNLIAKALKAEWLLLLNNDLILQPGWPEALAQMQKAHYDIIGSKLLYPNGTIQHFGKWFTLDWRPFHVLRHQPADHPMALQPRPFPDVTFACVAIRKVVFDDLGGLDEQYANGYEDDDFCLAAREAGAQIGVHPGMLATHLEAQTTGHDTANKAAMFQRFAAKWIETGRIQWATGVYQGWAET